MCRTADRYGDTRRQLAGADLPTRTLQRRSQYSACEQKVLARFFARRRLAQVVGGSVEVSGQVHGGVWPRLQAKAPARLAMATRFTDNGTTVTDNLTGLQWEKKTDDSTVHDKDDRYSWSAGFAAADGTAFTTFLPVLNGGACFAGQCDWRFADDL
jgi:hypothetical protein